MVNYAEAREAVEAISLDSDSDRTDRLSPSTIRNGDSVKFIKRRFCPSHGFSVRAELNTEVRVIYDECALYRCVLRGARYKKTP